MRNISLILMCLTLFVSGCKKERPEVLPTLLSSPPAAALPQQDDRALLIAINTYPNAPLAGCVNDAMNWAKYLKKKDFKESNILFLLNEKATRAEIIKALRWLTADAKRGDRRILVFSGHGVEFNGDTANAQPYGVNQAICPYDFGWSQNQMLIDTDIIGFFRAFTSDVKAYWVSDSCHSGDLSRSIIRGTPKVYPMAPLLARASVKRAQHGAKKTMARDALLNVGFVSGCKYNQTSADSVFGVPGVPEGALSHYLLEELNEDDTRPLSVIVEETNKSLRRDGYEQESQCEGARRNRPFLQ